MNLKQIKKLFIDCLPLLVFMVMLVLLFTLTMRYKTRLLSRESFIPMITRAQNRVSRNIRLTSDTVTEKFNGFVRKAKKTAFRTSGIGPYLK